MPLLTKLRIDKSWQMNLTVASRFRDISEIHINSLFKLRIELDEGESWTDVSLDFESRIRAVPFLSKFDKLERLCFGGKYRNTEGHTDGEDVEGFAPVEDHFYEGDDHYPHE